MPRIPRYVHADGVAHLQPQPPKHRLAVLTALGAASALNGAAAAVFALTASDGSPLHGLSLLLFMSAVTSAGAFVTYRGATDPARVSARHQRFLNEEQP